MRASALLGLVVILLGGSISGQETTKLPPVFLNHFYIVIDPATYQDIERNPFVRSKFAVTERRTTRRSDMSYTGLYLYGTNTYFEFFDPSSHTSGQVGFSGIAFGVDQAGGLQAIGRALSSNFTVEQEPVTRQYQEKQIPWFYLGGQEDFPEDAGLAVWLMEYHPRFLAEWNPQANGTDQGVSRKQVLQRYAAVLKDIPDTPYLEDVVALTIAVNEAGRGRLADLCKLLGYSERTVGDGRVLRGPGVELRILPQTGGLQGIQAITMRVGGKPTEQAEFRFGAKSVLRFRGDGLATWSF